VALRLISFEIHQRDKRFYKNTTLYQIYKNTTLYQIYKKARNTTLYQIYKKARNTTLYQIYKKADGLVHCVALRLISFEIHQRDKRFEKTNQGKSYVFLNSNNLI
jgi:hypothetical protein